MNSICPFFGAFAFLCQGPLHIFITPLGHFGLVNSSALSTTRSHGQFLFDNRARNLLRASSTFSFVDAGIFSKARFSATDLRTFSSLSPLIQNTPPVKCFLHLQANSTAREVFPHPPRPQMAFVQQEMPENFEESLLDTKLCSNHGKAFSRPVNSGNRLGAVHGAAISSLLCPIEDFAFKVSTSDFMLSKLTSKSAILFFAVLRSGTTSSRQPATSFRSSLITSKVLCKSSRSSSNLLKFSTLFDNIEISCLRTSKSVNASVSCFPCLAISSRWNTPCSFSLDMSLWALSSLLIISEVSCLIFSLASSKSFWLFPKSLLAACTSVSSSASWSLSSAIFSLLMLLRVFTSVTSATSD